MKDPLSASSPKLTARARAAKAERDQRLAEALRANLRRRKAQARGRETPQPESAPAESGPDEELVKHEGDMNGDESPGTGRAAGEG